MSKLFSNPQVFDPDRFAPERREDKNLMAYQPFGGGKHKCSGNSFAMFQIKAIFAVLLRRYEFELVDAPESYVDNYSEMIVQPKSPCRVRYRLRSASTFSSEYGRSQPPAKAGCPFHGDAKAEVAKPRITVKVDRDLCQGHAMCMNEAPAYFKVGEDHQVMILKEDISDADLQKVESAVRYCPNSALKIERS
jgi:sterol 14-demethylase